MALFTVDSNNVFGQSVEEAGVYNVAISPSSEFKNSSTGKPMAVLDYEVLDGKYKGGLIRFDNEIWDGSTPEKASQSAKRFSTIAVALGANDGTAFDSIEQFVSQAVSHRLAVSVDWETGTNGKTYLVVKGYRQFMPDGSKPNGKTRPAGKPANNGGGFGSHAQTSGNSTGFGTPKATGGFGTPANNNAGKGKFDDIPSDMPF